MCVKLFEVIYFFNSLKSEGVVYADLQTTQQQQRQAQQQQQIADVPTKKRKVSSSPSSVKLEPVPSPAPLSTLCCTSNEATDAATLGASANALLSTANMGDVSLDGHSQDR